MRGLNLGIIKKLKIKLPPIELQNHFEYLLKKVESLKAKYETSLQELENLYGSLSQRAFRGELDVSKVPIHHELRIQDTITVQEVVEPKVSQTKSEEYVLDLKTFQQLIKKKFSSKFTFDELQHLLSTIKFDSKPEYSQLKDMLVECLEGKDPFLHQKFGQPSHNINNPGKKKQMDKEKQMVFSVAE